MYSYYIVLVYWDVFVYYTKWGIGEAVNHGHGSTDSFVEILLIPSSNL